VTGKPLPTDIVAAVWRSKTTTPCAGISPLFSERRHSVSSATSELRAPTRRTSQRQLRDVGIASEKRK